MNYWDIVEATREVLTTGEQYGTWGMHKYVQEDVPSDRKAWFDAVNKATHHWDRKGPGELVLWFDGYKPQQMHDAEKVLMRFGGRALDQKFDQHSGKTMMIVKEPKFKPHKDYED